VASGASNGSQPPQATDAIQHRERASSFGLAGRHRLVPGQLEDLANLGTADTAPYAAAKRPAWFEPPADRPAQTSRQDVLPAQESQARTQPDPAPGGTHQGLPMRVRQTSLAPQLRADPQPDPAADPHPADGTARSPEQTRRVIDSLQQGWQRGRTDDLDHPGGGPGHGLGNGRGGTPGWEADRSNGEDA
jgi:hypothetical protein